MHRRRLLRVLCRDGGAAIAPSSAAAAGHLAMAGVAAGLRHATRHSLVVGIRDLGPIVERRLRVCVHSVRAAMVPQYLRANVLAGVAGRPRTIRLHGD